MLEYYTQILDCSARGVREARREEKRKGIAVKPRKCVYFFCLVGWLVFLCSLGCLRVFLRHDWPLQENKLSEVLKNESEIVAKHFEPLSVQTLLFNVTARAG